MKERPLPYKGPMVRATLADTKTMTRRVVKPQPDSISPDGTPARFFHKRAIGSGYPVQIPCPYGVPGDRLWVREAWRAIPAVDHLPPRELTPAHRIWYEADAPHQPGFGKLRPGMFMPRWASRITLEVVSVRIERLQDISEADAIAEGIQRYSGPMRWVRYLDAVTGEAVHSTARGAFFALWIAINGQASFDANPWVWVVEFRRLP